MNPGNQLPVLNVGLKSKVRSQMVEWCLGLRGVMLLHWGGQLIPRFNSGLEVVARELAKMSFGV